MSDQIVEHVLLSTDTLMGLAYKYLGDALRWKEIVDFNGLDYPYIADEAFKETMKARGFIQVTRTSSSSELVIPAGTQFATKRTETNPVAKVFESIETVTIPTDASEAGLWVKCTAPGTFGNVLSYSITQVLTKPIAAQLSAVYNVDPFTNGKTFSVKSTGDTILVQVAAGYASSDFDNFSSTAAYLKILGGTDLELDNDGDLVSDGYGDLGATEGLENIESAVKYRFMTEKGELAWHPWYGVALDEIIGKPQRYIPKLIELRLLEGLEREDRISEMTILELYTEGTAVFVKIALKLFKGTKTEVIGLQVRGDI